MRTLVARAVAAAALVWSVAAAAPSPAPTTTVTVFAAASLAAAFTKAGHALEARQPGLKVRFNFAGSQQLAVQIEQGAPADVFASADERWMNDVREHALIEGEPQIFAHNRLTAIVPRANPARIDRLQDLARHGVKLILAAEAVPVGAYARQALRNLASAPGFDEAYARRVLANVVSEEETVRGVLGKVRLGEGDAGIVYRSDVSPEIARELRVIDIPDAYNVLANYPIAAMKNARQSDAARAFIAFVHSTEGQTILREAGLIPVAAATPARP